MVRNYKRKTEKATVSADVMMKAARAVKLDGNSQSIRRTAAKFNINYRTLTRFCEKISDEDLINNDVTKVVLGYKKTNSIFNQGEELSLVSYIHRAKDVYLGLAPLQVRTLAYQFARTNGKLSPGNWADSGLAGADWLTGFLSRHPDLSLGNPEQTSSKKACSSNDAYRRFFLRLSELQDRYKFEPNEIWNMDECGVTTVRTNDRVYTRRGFKQVTNIIPKELVIVVSTISAGGRHNPPFFIFPTVSFEHTFLSGAPPGSSGCANISGWMKETEFLLFLKHFHSHVKSTPKSPCLLILVSHWSHLSIEGLDFARDNGIIMLSLPLRSTIKLQPFGRSVLGLFTEYTTVACSDWMLLNPGETMTIYDIPGIVNRTYPLAMLPEIIISGFSKSGIYPLNTDLIRDKDVSPSTDINKKVPTEANSVSTDDEDSSQNDKEPPQETESHLSDVSPPSQDPLSGEASSSRKTLSPYTSSGKDRNRLTKRAKPSLFLPDRPEPPPKPKERRRCALPTCQKGVKDGVTLHSFPRMYERILEWEKICKLTKKASRGTQICSEHFLPTDFCLVGTTLTLKKTARPTRNLDGNEGEKSEQLNHEFAGSSGDYGVAQSSSSAMSFLQAHIKYETTDDTSNHSSTFSETNHLKDEPDFSTDIRDREGGLCEQDESLSQTGRTVPTLTENPGFVEVIVANEEDDLVHGMLSQHFPEVRIESANQSGCLLNETSFKSEFLSMEEDDRIQADPLHISILELIEDDVQLKAFTAISFPTLNKLTDLVLDYNKQSANSKASVKQKIVLTLCRLRLNLSFECLGQLFGIDRLICIQYFSSMVHLLALVLQGAVYWPSREEIRNNLSEDFKHFRSTRVVLYCMQILMHSKDCLNCRLMLNSHYEGAVQLKILVGLAPTGKITYLSKVYNSEVTDDDIFKESDLIRNNLLEPVQDAIIIDEGFMIEEGFKILNEKFVMIHRLPLVQNIMSSDYQTAYTSDDVDLVRAYVKQSIQNFKMFKILQDKMTSTEIAQVDDIFIVIAGLVNLS